MSEQHVYFQSDVKLEGMLDEAGADRAVVVSHPHPLYGGDMNNPVVTSVCHAYRQQGCTTLRFNFRGVGGSGGRYDHGRGEQRDLLAALGFVAARGVAAIDLAGYSFGAWINASTRVDTAPVMRMVLVSPPVALIDFADIGQLAQLSLVITGGLDTLAPATLIRNLLPQWNAGARMVVIDGADHFYGGHLPELRHRIAAWLRLDSPPSPPLSGNPANRR